MGAEHRNHRHDHKPGGERKSKSAALCGSWTWFSTRRTHHDCLAEEMRPVLADGEQRAVWKCGGDAEEHQSASLLHRTPFPHQEHKSQKGK